MSNAWDGNRYVIDTAGSTLYPSGMPETAALGVPLNIKGLRWVGATTAGHACVIQDSDSRVLWESLAAGGNNVESDYLERKWQKEFKVPTLGSGRLYIYVGP